MRSILLFLFLILQSCTFLVNRVAFHPDNRNHIQEDLLPTHVVPITIPTHRRDTLHGYHFHNLLSNKIILFFHGNAGNIAHRLTDMQKLYDMGYSVIGISYRGYGKSSGRPSERKVYEDGQRLYEYVKMMGYTDSTMIVFGRSIGSTVAINLSQNKTFHKLVLVTPLTTGKDQVRQMDLKLLVPFAGKAFNNREKITRCKAPLLIVHGTEDRLIPHTMGAELYKLAPNAQKIALIDGAGHNNISSDFSGEYWKVIKSFLMQDLKSQSTRIFNTIPVLYPHWPQCHHNGISYSIYKALRDI